MIILNDITSLKHVDITNEKQVPPQMHGPMILFNRNN